MEAREKIKLYPDHTDCSIFFYVFYEMPRLLWPRMSELTPDGKMNQQLPAKTTKLLTRHDCGTITKADVFYSSHTFITQSNFSSS